MIDPHVVLPQVAPAVLERPERQGVDLIALKHGQGRSFSAVVPPAPIDPSICPRLLQCALQWLHLALVVVLVNVLLHVVTVPSSARHHPDTSISDAATLSHTA